MDEFAGEESGIFGDGDKIARSSGKGLSVTQVYLDGHLKNAGKVNEDEKSFGIFMHSLILCNYAEMMKIDSPKDVVVSECERAIYRYTSSKGFDKRLIDSIAPRVARLNSGVEDVTLSAHLINEKVRIVSKGTPDELLNRCSYILQDSRLVKLTRKILREVHRVMKDMLERSQVVYAVAIKDVARISEAWNGSRQVGGMTLVALVGLG